MASVANLMVRNAIRGALDPPPGVTANFVNPVDGRRVHLVTSIAAPIAAGLFFLLRFYTRVFITRTLGWDDYTCAIAMLLAIGYAISESILNRYGIGRHKWDVPYEMYHPNFPKMRLVTFSLYVVFMYFVKLSILLLYLRVFTVVKRFRIMTWITILVVTAYSFAGFVGTMARCNPSKGACQNVTHLSIISSVLNILTDVAILILPIRQVWRLQASTKQRIGVLVIFALGSFVCFVSIGRLYMYIKASKSEDDTWHVRDGSVWTLIEANVGLICACMPALKAFLQVHAPTIFSGAGDYSKSPTGLRASRTDQSGNNDPNMLELGAASPMPKDGIGVTTEVVIETK